MIHQSVIVSISRTPIGSFQGSLSSVSATTLGATVLKAALERSKVKKEDVDEVIMGNVLSAGIGQAPARQAAIFGGLPVSVKCTTINKVCGSGLKSVMLADQIIRCNDADIIIAGGMENMSQTPFYLRGTRNGMRLGHKEIQDSMIHDGLWDPYNNIHMGNCAEALVSRKKYNREEQDLFAVESYKRSNHSIASGYFADEIIPVEIQKKGQNNYFLNTDEEPQKVDYKKIRELRPVFDKNGTITPANASSISDGAAAVMVMSNKKARSMDVQPICKILCHTSFAHEPINFTTAPSHAINKVLSKCNLSISDIDLFEINEAFAAVVLDSIKDCNIPPDKVNIHGGAVSLGHPIGASGARILVTLISALKQKQMKFGLATICIGGGEAAAMIVEMI